MSAFFHSLLSIAFIEICTKMVPFISFSTHIDLAIGLPWSSHPSPCLHLLSSHTCAQQFRAAYTYLRSFEVQGGLHVSPFIPSSGRPTRISVHSKFRAAYTYLRPFQVQGSLHVSPFIPSSGRPTRISVHSKFRAAYTYLRSFQVQDGLHVSPFIPSSGRPTRISVHSKFRTAYTYLSLFSPSSEHSFSNTSIQTRTEQSDSYIVSVARGY